MNLPLIVSVPSADDARHRWFVGSDQWPGRYYLVELARAHDDHRLTCSCPYGQTGAARPCRHLRAVTDLVAALAGAEAPVDSAPAANHLYVGQFDGTHCVVGSSGGAPCGRPEAEHPPYVDTRAAS